jgi:hypothetical protein
VNTLLQTGSFALLLATAIVLLPSPMATAGSASNERERATQSWESFGSNLKRPQEHLDAGTLIEPHIGMRLSSLATLNSNNMSESYVQ